MGKGFCVLHEGHPENCVFVLEPRTRKAADGSGGPRLRHDASPPPSPCVDVSYDGHAGAYRATVLCETADFLWVRYDAELRPGSAARRGDRVWEHKSACRPFGT